MSCSRTKSALWFTMMMQLTSGAAARGAGATISGYGAGKPPSAANSAFKAPGHAPGPAGARTRQAPSGSPANGSPCCAASSRARARSCISAGQRTSTVPASTVSASPESAEGGIGRFPSRYPTMPRAMPPDSPIVLKRGKHAEVLAWGEHHVLKLFRPGHGRAAIAEELRQAQMAHALGIPTARPEQIIEHHGRAGIVFERLHGPTLYDLLVTRAAPLEELAALLCDIGSAIHRCAVAGIPAIEARLAARIVRAQGLPDSTRHAAIEALHRLPGGKTLCHGDLHPA